MNIDQRSWNKEIEDTIDHPYAAAIMKVAGKVIELLDDVKAGEVDANALILKADEILQEGITGNMASYVALLVSKYSDKGKEFKRSWNLHYGGDPEAAGVVNPAILIIDDKKDGENTQDNSSVRSPGSGSV